jgi:hypothetical protein
MSEAANIPEHIRVLAEQAGLARALKLFPDGVNAAAERGLRPLGELPASQSTTTQLAHVFNPARFEKSE